MRNHKPQVQREIGPGLLGRLAGSALACALLLGMPGIVAAQDTASQRDTTQSNAQADTTGTDSTRWGYPVDSNPDAQNPPGYRGMERPASLPDSGAQADTAAPADATSRVNQMERQDTASGENRNPPGYRGMERPVGADSATTEQGDTGSIRSDTAAGTTSGDTLREDGISPDSGQ